MKNTAIAFIAILFAITLFVDARAQNRMHMKEKPDRIIDKLNLTEDQSKLIDDLRSKHQEQMIDLRAEQQKARLENRNLRKSDNLNRSDLLKHTQKMNSIRNKISEARANLFMDIYDVLSDEQRKTWVELKSDRLGDRKFMGKGFHDKKFRRK